MHPFVDYWHVIGVHAAKAYGLYHTVSLIESNTTHKYTKQKTIYVDDGSDDTDGVRDLNRRILRSGIFVPVTDVKLNFYIDDNEKIGTQFEGITREHLQRQAMIQVWKDNGMTKDDIGFVSEKRCSTLIG